MPCVTAESHTPEEEGRSELDKDFVLPKASSKKNDKKNVSDSDDSDSDYEYHILMRISFIMLSRFFGECKSSLESPRQDSGRTYLYFHKYKVKYDVNRGAYFVEH